MPLRRTVVARPLALAAVESSVDFPWAPPGASGRLAFGAPVDVVATSELAEVRAALARVERECAAGRYAVGFVSYEAAAAFDPAMRARGGSGVPLVWFGLHDAPLPDGHLREPAAYACSVWRPGTDEATYAASIDAIRAAIARGDTYQVNHTMRLRARFAGDPYGAWVDLRRAQRDGWFAYVDTGEHCVASVSPELFFAWDGNELVTRPMKGTRRRSRDAAEDAALADALRGSAKDLAENLMIVDLLRNDVARVCEPGSVRVPRLFDVEAYPTVWQLTSTVTGVGEPGLGVERIFGALFPCGSITGAPKVRTMKLIAEFEDRPRGVYCGAVGVVYPGGAAAFNVAIRTLVVDRGPRAAARHEASDPTEPTPEDRSGADLVVGTARYDVGGGVVWDSEGRDEYAEALAKAAVLDMTQRDFALVETVLVRDGVAWLEDRHLDRMAASAQWFGWPFDRLRAAELLRSGSVVVGDATRGPAVAGPGHHGAPEISGEGLAGERTLVRARLLLKGSGELSLECARWSELPGHLDAGGPTRPVGLALTAVHSSDPWLRHKTTRRGTYRRALDNYRGVAQPFDVLLHNEREEITEFTIGNLVLDIDGELVTPPDSSGLLPGTLRAELLAGGVIRERVVHLADLTPPRSMWLINAVRGWVPVALAPEVP